MKKWVISVVVIKDTALGVINTQNRLYIMDAVSKDEAIGKSFRLATKEFPEHYFHTVCGVEIEYTPKEVIENFRQQVIETVLTGVEYSDGDGLRTMDSRGLQALAKLIETLEVK